MRAAAITLLGLVVGVTAQESPCPACVEARYWQVEPGYWSSATPNLNSFPERQLDPPLAGADLGVAFSGGGTRSASASIGQLRGLVQNGWLDRVKYVTAVSGGSWAAVPFTYYPGERLTDLLGTFDVDLTKLDLVDLEKRPNGSLALQVTRSGLAASGVEEAFQFLPDQQDGEIDLGRIRSVGTMVRDGLRKVRGRELPDPSRQNKTYSHILGRIFIDPLVKDGNRMPYGWTRSSVLDITDVSRQPQMDFQQVPDNRPFLIVGGTIIWMRPGFVYPRLIPIEYTPLYTGVRQQFGNLGGTYVMPWAYDREHVIVSGGRLLVDPAKVRMFTLADVIASSGAAPQLQLLLGESLPARVRGAAMQAAGAFPSFRPTAIRDGQFVAPDGEMAHGDGGFTDNLGLMPLLARQVRHVIAFVNSNKTYAQNDQLQSYFFPLSTQSGSGDKTMNAVFPKAKYRELLDGLDGATKAGGPAIFCQALTVANNELYNIAGYGGLKVCWVYNHASSSWRELLPDQLKTWLGNRKSGGRKDLQHFPYYATFKENRPYVIKLNTLQVNLLANLSAWTITNEVGRRRITDAFGSAVLPASTVAR